MQSPIDKRSGEAILYDIDVSADLGENEVVTAINSISVDINPGSSLIVAASNTWSINNAEVSYQDGTSAKIGSVMQGRIAGGAQSGLNSYLYTVRISYYTNINYSPNLHREATFQILFQDDL